MNKLSKAIRLAADYKSFRALLSFRYSGYIFQNGWFESLKTRSAVNASGEPIPWITYPSIRFLGERLPARAALFEFGSGNSTLYFARNIRSVVSVEHDREWFERIRLQLPRNAEIVYAEISSNGAYSRAAADSKKKYDIIFVDGRDRVNCIRNSFRSLKSDGVVVLDDAERLEYRDGITFLERRRFKRIDFWGIAPGVMEEKCTAVLYRTKNCLNI
ncbi:MAG TPA: class I SAM-dependent methyltransferase [Bacteroidota bacterium]|nr:class I SAM-dependent methyltransferase [Bacteroidota bacterium]